MSVIGDLKNKLVGTEALTNLVNRRIYTLILPQKCKLPAVTINKVNETPIHFMGSDTEPYRPYFSVNCWAENYKDVYDVRTQVINALKDFSGSMGSTTVQRIFLESETEIYEAQTNIYHIILDFVIWHE